MVLLRGFAEVNDSVPVDAKFDSNAKDDGGEDDLSFHQHRVDVSLKKTILEKRERCINQSCCDPL